MLYVEPHYIAISRASQIRDYLLETDDWARYDNPFESKYVLRKPYPVLLQQIIDDLRNMRYLSEKMTGEELDIDTDGQYEAIFKYDVWDRLALHKDADKYPITGREKVVTACLYLSTDDQVGSPLEFYDGVLPERRTALVEPIFNTLVMFDNYWHGCPDPVLCGTRIVVTVSFLGRVLDSGRERAYFAPKPGEVWTQEKQELRDLRADPKRYHEVYRV